MVRVNSGWVLAIAMVLTGCNNGSDGSDGGSGGGSGGGGAGGGTPALGFQPSNVDLSAHDFSTLADVDVTGDCDLYGDQQPDGTICGSHTVDWLGTQSDGSRIHVYAVKSFTLEQTAKLTMGGAFAIAIVSFGDLKINGPLVASARTSTPGPGGFAQIPSFTKGAGPGGGPAGVADAMGPPPGTGYLAGIAGGGGSACGVGGKGATEGDTAGPVTVMPLAAPAAYGTADLRPIVGGSSGGVGGLGAAGAGGGAVQLVAAGALSIGTLGSITVGGGGGVSAGLTNGQQEASGGGSGGSVLLEGNTVSITGVVAANGGGGGGYTTSGSDATADANSAPGGTDNNSPLGGAGGAGANVDGVAGLTGTNSAAGAGGGAAGRIRINSHTGAATITGTLSPSATTACVSQGMLRATGSGM